MGIKHFYRYNSGLTECRFDTRDKKEAEKYMRQELKENRHKVHAFMRQLKSLSDGKWKIVVFVYPLDQDTIEGGKQQR